MLRTIIDRRLICTAFFPFASSSDNTSNDKWVDTSQVKGFLSKYRCYFYDEKGYPTKEVQSVLNVTCAGSATGFILGALYKLKDVPQRFKHENQATLYENKFQYQQNLQRRIEIVTFKAGFPFAMKVGLFCFLFSSMSSFFYVYRGYKFDILNSTFSGAITGFIFKMNMGVKGSIAGTVVGTILGTFYGSVTQFFLWISGAEMENLYEAGAKLMNARRDKIREYAKALKADELSELQKTYIKKQEANEALSKKEKE
ncbi:RPII140-upstream gene protein [Bombus terrestris]|uniref:Complex I assembly factor TIMMDC1, mitochondrial n=1 Tax=Bombus terrestris TaxID=30195 RepID=A0A9B0BVU2_BOMTE|nr:RPII140-upstream gene protein [Bombus terrestris]